MSLIQIPETTLSLSRPAIEADDHGQYVISPKEEYMIEFDDGTSLTYEAAAQLIEAEGRLGVYSAVAKNGDRCVGGVLIDAEWREMPSNWKRMAFDPLSSRMIRENNRFAGTPEERAVHMAQWFRALGHVAV